MQLELSLEDVAKIVLFMEEQRKQYKQQYADICENTELQTIAEYVKNKHDMKGE